MSISDLFSFVERRGIFDLGGVSFAITGIQHDPGWDRVPDFLGRHMLVHGPARVTIQAVGVHVVTSHPPAPPKPRREPLARWAHIRKRQPWALQVHR